MKVTENSYQTNESICLFPLTILDLTRYVRAAGVSIRSSSWQTVWLHRSRTLAKWSASPTVMPSILLSQGFQTGLLRWILFHVARCFGCVYRRHVNAVSKVFLFEHNLPRRGWFAILSLCPYFCIGRVTPAIRRWTVISNTSIFLFISSVIVHVTALYNTTDKRTCYILPDLRACLIQSFYSNMYSDFRLFLLQNDASIYICDWSIGMPIFIPEMFSFHNCNEITIGRLHGSSFSACTALFISCPADGWYIFPFWFTRWPYLIFITMST